MDTKTRSSHAWLVATTLAALGLVACAAETEDLGEVEEGVTTAATAPTPNNETARPKGQRRGAGGPERFGRLLYHFDEDKDGKVELSSLPEHKQQWLAAADENKDGSLTLDELRAYHEQRHAHFMKKADANGDGRVSEEERSSFSAEQRTARFAEADQNGDGFIVEGEVDAWRWSRLSLADSDQDNQVSREEFINGDHRRRGKAGEPGCGRKGGHGGHRGPPDPGKFFETFDQDGDGKVKLEDLPQRAQERLASADVDGDGVLSLSELEDHMAKRRFNQKAGTRTGRGKRSQ